MELNRVEIPFREDVTKFGISFFRSGGILSLLFLMDYCITYHNFSSIIFKIICVSASCIFLLGSYWTIKCILIFKEKKPSIIFDEEKITSCGVLKTYSIKIECFEGYKFVICDGTNYINIYPKSYKEFKKALGFNLMRRRTFSSIKAKGYEGLMISFRTISPNYEATIEYLNNTFGKADEK